MLDYLNARQVRANLVAEDEKVHRGLRVTSRRAMEGQRLVKRMVLTRLDTGATRKVTESVRLYEPGELAAMARACGLDLFLKRGPTRAPPSTKGPRSAGSGFLPAQVR